MVDIKAPLVPYKFTSEIYICTKTRDEKMFRKTLQRQWELFVEKMFEQWRERKEFFNILKKVTRYNQEKVGTIVDAINTGI